MARKLSPKFIEQVQELSRLRWNRLVERERSEVVRTLAAKRQSNSRRPHLRIVK